TKMLLDEADRQLKGRTLTPEEKKKEQREQKQALQDELIRELRAINKREKRL
ncbi:MAG: hypothetical protein GX215_05370, partial [Clostridiales Family XIII bacterium]|nr:hypothetical protein [Clostridiales Family XIII bacterium]